MRTAVVIPAYQAAREIGELVRGLVHAWPEPPAVLVVDDGSRDATAEHAARAGAHVLRHERNLGKGAALATGLSAALERGFETALTLDADGQHPPSEALRLHRSCVDPTALVIGVRDLGAARAPRPNRLSNGFSNLVLSAMSGRRLLDTQCGLRRYPIARTLELDARETGFGFEAEVLLRAAITGRVPIVHVPVRVLYPPERRSHFHPVRDPARIVARVVRTFVELRGGMANGSALRSDGGGREVA
jgi:glycosyltransferase involved in cell wall biosynthesis